MLESLTVPSNNSLCDIYKVSLPVEKEKKSSDQMAKTSFETINYHSLYKFSARSFFRV